MGFNLKWNRRGFLGGLGAIASLLAMPRRSFGWDGPEKKNTALTGFGESGNPYEELGVTTVINAEGTMTTLGGSLIRPEVEVIMAQASMAFRQRARARRSSGEAHCADA